MNIRTYNKRAQRIARYAFLKKFAVKMVFLCTIFLAWYASMFAQNVKNVLADEPFSNYNIGQQLKGLSGGKGWKGAWSGERADGFLLQPPQEYNGVKLGAGSVLVAATTTRKIHRELLAPAPNGDGTIWIRFFFRKETGIGRAGFSLMKNEKEQLFIGATGGKGQAAIANKTEVNINDDRQHLILIRIDFRQEQHTAYVFIDPGTASIPDPEGANVTLTGTFSFDRIACTAAGDGNTKIAASFGPICIAGKFEDAVALITANKKEEQASIGAGMKVISWKKEGQKLIVATTGGVLQLTPFLQNTLKVQFGTQAAMDSSKSFAVDAKPTPVSFNVRDNESSLDLQTNNYKVRIIKATSCIQLFNPSGRLLIEEWPDGGRPAVTDNAVMAANVFKLSDDEALYGLGQFRDGFMNLRGKRRELVQFNTQAAVPVLLSTNGWGMFWDNPSRTVFNDSQRGMSFSSDVGGEIKYYLFTGSGLDDLIAAYRNLTGEAPIPPRWALGYHQSRNRYASREEVLAVSKRMREEGIPFSSVFIDYYYWGKYGTGSHRFDETAFPHMPGLAEKVHKDYHGKLVATVWPTFKPGTPNYEAMKEKGFLLEGVKALDGIIYDVFNPQAAAYYWQLVKKDLLKNGIDGWFLDGPEPDNINTFLPAMTYAGPALKVRNVYPLLHSANFYHGLLNNDPGRRPYILTRCAWASQQKNGTAIWSGDIPSTFDELKKQIPAGLNFVATGIPYWTTDIGGYSGGNPEDVAYQEVYTRWFQYGVFCPVFRSHGRRYPGDTKGPNELWAYGDKVQDICTQFDMLRYRLMPYIYSLSGDITQKNYTVMRLLAFDFPGDKAAHNIPDQFMYGPAFLVNPVTDSGARERKVYLPNGTDWINFWNGEKIKGGRTITADAPIEKIPVFVKAGSIIPLGAPMQYTDERPADTIELRVYRGRDGQFELYEDDGQTFDYKKGGYKRTLFKWNESTGTLTVSDLSGAGFKGRLTRRVFNVVWVTPEKGNGMAASKPDAVIEYSGKPVTIKFAHN